MRHARSILPLLALVGGMGLPLLVGCAGTEYAGRVFDPTDRVDIYFPDEEITRANEVMGLIEVGPERTSVRSLERELAAEAMRRGADAMVIEGWDLDDGDGEGAETATEPPRYILEDGSLRIEGSHANWQGEAYTENRKSATLQGRLLRYLVR